MTEVAFQVAERLARAGSPSPGFEARLLVAHVLGVEPSQLVRVDAVTDEQRSDIDDLVARRAAGVPLQHLTGVAYFRYESLAVGPGVFIPRPETEEMVGWALRQLA
ncbi:MAG TPA: peptide chain release factor N(5)-glutamine methyltransferase, partial [Arachnia sp.]|nr:peptide chain release factor N(5)-glutamine methyltransferase [Arachnia sp.]